MQRFVRGAGVFQLETLADGDLYRAGADHLEEIVGYFCSSWAVRV